MATAEGSCRHRRDFDLPFYERDSVNKEIDVNGDGGQLSLGRPKLSELKAKFQNSKKTYNEYRSKKQRDKRDVQTLERLIDEDPTLDYHVNKITEKIAELDDFYYEDLV